MKTKKNAEIIEEVIGCILDAGEHVLAYQIKRGVKPKKYPGIILGYLLRGLRDQNDYLRDWRNRCMDDACAVKLLGLYREVFLKVNGAVVDSELYHSSMLSIFRAFPDKKRSSSIYFERFPELTKELIDGIVECKGVPEALKFVVKNDIGSHDFCKFFRPVVDKLCDQMYYRSADGYDRLLVDLDVSPRGPTAFYFYAVEKVSLCRVKRMMKPDLLSEARGRIKPVSSAPTEPVSAT